MKAFDVSQSPPFGDALGFEFIEAGDDSILLKVPYASHLVGDPATGVIHGGVITAMLDNACGRAVQIARQTAGRGDEGAIATLDLRIDYMGPAEPGKDLYARADCFRLAQHIAFVRATAYTERPEQPVATCVSAFMLGTPSERAGRQS